jgi:hypothetical protein
MAEIAPRSLIILRSYQQRNCVPHALPKLQLDRHKLKFRTEYASFSQFTSKDSPRNPPLKMASRLCTIINRHILVKTFTRVKKSRLVFYSGQKKSLSLLLGSNLGRQAVYSGQARPPNRTAARGKDIGDQGEFR